MSEGMSVPPTGLTEYKDSSPGLHVLQSQREVLRQRLIEGATGSEVTQAFSDFMDALLIARFREVIQQGNAGVRAGWQQCCLVAMGVWAAGISSLFRHRCDDSHSGQSRGGR